MRAIAASRHGVPSMLVPALGCLGMLVVGGCTAVDAGGAGFTGSVPSLAPAAATSAAFASPESSSLPGASAETATEAGMVVSEDGEPAREVDALPLPPETTQPGLATYTCTGGEEFTVEQRPESVVVASGGDSIELPAAPAGQKSRFAQTVYALVLDGPEAMWMAGRNPPADCRRPAAAQPLPAKSIERQSAAAAAPQGR